MALTPIDTTLLVFPGLNDPGWSPLRILPRKKLEERHIVDTYMDYHTEFVPSQILNHAKNLLRGRRAILFGTSLGGLLALELAELNMLGQDFDLAGVTLWNTPFGPEDLINRNLRLGFGIASRIPLFQWLNRFSSLIAFNKAEEPWEEAANRSLIKEEADYRNSQSLTAWLQSLRHMRDWHIGSYFGLPIVYVRATGDTLVSAGAVSRLYGVTSKLKILDVVSPHAGFVLAPQACAKAIIEAIDFCCSL